MFKQVNLTDFFGDGLCLYLAEFDSPESYTGDDEKKVAGPFSSEQEGWAYANQHYPDIEQMSL